MRWSTGTCWAADALGEVRKVACGRLLKREDVWLEEVTDREWSVCVGPMDLGGFGDWDYQIMELRGQLSIV